MFVFGVLRAGKNVRLKTKGLALLLCEEAQFYVAQNKMVYSSIRTRYVQSQCRTDLTDANTNFCAMSHSSKLNHFTITLQCADLNTPNI